MNIKPYLKILWFGFLTVAQISFKIPEDDMEFLRWYSAQRGTGKSVLYKEATLDAFRRWKLDVLLKHYAGGAIGFKQLCNLGKISFQEGMMLIQENGIEPPIPEVVDDYTDSVRHRIED